MRGFTLLEVLLTLVLFTAGFLALSEALSLGISASGNNEASLVAYHLAEEKMELEKNTAYSNIVSEARASVSGFSSYEREVVVSTPQTNLKQVTVNVYWFNRANELSVSLVTYAANVS